MKSRMRRIAEYAIGVGYTRTGRLSIYGSRKLPTYSIDWGVSCISVWESTVDFCQPSNLSRSGVTYTAIVVEPLPSGRTSVTVKVCEPSLFTLAGCVKLLRSASVFVIVVTLVTFFFRLITVTTVSAVIVCEMGSSSHR